MIGDVAEEVGKFLFCFLVETVCFYTGELVLHVITSGYKKPKWDYYVNESPTRFVILTEVSVWIGFLFWVFVIGFLARSVLT